MKIAIYEIVHLDWVIPLAELLTKDDRKISFFVHKSMKEDIESSLSGAVYNNYNWIYLDDENVYSRYRFLSKEVKKNKYDIFWLNTADSKHLVFALLKLSYPHLKLLVNVHDVNDFFAPSLSWHIKRSLRYIGKKLLAKNSDAYLLNAEKMKDYITAKRLTKKACYSIAPVYYKPVKSNSIDEFIIVISGSVDERRRDYQTALEAWKIFINKASSIEAKMVLAGGINEHGQNILAQCQRDKILKETVVLFTNPIPEQDFQQLISSASLLLSPQVIETTTQDGITEIYGITKNSGNSYDAIRHAKPFIVPAALNIPKELEQCTVRYDSAAELAAILLKLSADKEEFNQLCGKAQECSEKFRYEAVKKKMDNIVKAISAL